MKFAHSRLFGTNVCGIGIRHFDQRRTPRVIRRNKFERELKVVLARTSIKSRRYINISSNTNEEEERGGNTALNPEKRSREREGKHNPDVRRKQSMSRKLFIQIN